MPEMINCGERRIQTIGRISINDLMERHDMKEGDFVEVFIKKVKKNE